MATDKQVAANRRNAKKSTGPKTQIGKSRSRANAIRHGLTAETVVAVFENADEYSAFEKRVIADYDPQTTIEHQLVVRLASLLWRLRRAVAVESGLLYIQGRITRDNRADLQTSDSRDRIAVFRRFLEPRHLQICGGNARAPLSAIDIRPTMGGPFSISEVAQSFLDLAEADRSVLDLILRYETTLSRQLFQTMICLAQCRKVLGTATVSPEILQLLRKRTKR